MNSTVSDRDFLGNYIRFAALHRWQLANVCFERFLKTEDNSPERGHLALEIFCCYLFLMEDILMWYYVLKESRTSSSANLMDALNTVNLSPSLRSKALEEIESMSVAEFMTLLGFPQTYDVLQSRSSAEQHGIRDEQVAKLQQALARGVKTFLHGNTGFWRERTFSRCLNKIKHGLLVMRRRETSDDHEFVAIFPNGNQADVTLPCVTTEETETRMIFSQVVNFTVVLIGTLTVLFQTRFGCFPEGEPPKELVRAFEDGCGLDIKPGN